MQTEKEGYLHIAEVLEETKKALSTKNAFILKKLSDHVMHGACSYQDSGTITMTVLIYTLSKLLERGDNTKIKNWQILEQKLILYLSLATQAIRTQKQSKFEEYMQRARNTLTSYSINLKPYIQDVMKKSAINKGLKMYEHGLSQEKTARLLGITQWELSEYIGQKTFADKKQIQSMDIKKRAKMALEFFS